VQGRMVSWGIQMGGIAARRAGDREAFAEFVAAARSTPFDESLSAFPHILRRLQRYTHFPQWWEHLPEPAYWNEMSPAYRIGDRPIRAAVLHVGGWYDAYCPATIEAFNEIARRAPVPQRLLIGPWTHLIWARRVGADFGPQASSPVDAQQLLWFDRFLKDIDNGIDRGDPVQLFDLTAKAWKSFPAWPAARTAALHLGGDGRAAAASNGRLSDAPAAEAGTETVVHDPWRPVPAFGGYNGRPDGMQDRAAIDARADVACFTSAPLTEELFIAGDVALELHLESTRPSFDISAVLSRMTPDGRVLTLTQGYATIAPNATRTPFVLPLRATCATIGVGDALRLSIAGAAFPAFPVNPGTGKHPAHAHAIEHEVTDIAIRHGRNAGSILFLPVQDPTG
jgi:putative CocE/NonD family hydrolase